MSIREQLRGVVRKTRDIGDVSDDNSYDVLDSERRLSAAARKSPTTSSPTSTTNGSTRSTLQQMMAEQSSQMKVADDRHKTEYLPLLDEAIRAVGGDPRAPLVSGGSGALAFSNTPSRSPVRRGQSPTLRQVLGGQASAPVTNATPTLPRIPSNLNTANRSPRRPVSPPATTAARSTSPPTQQSSNYQTTTTSQSNPTPPTRISIHSNGASGATHMSSVSSDTHVGIRSLDSTQGGPDLLDSTQRPILSSNASVHVHKSTTSSASSTPPPVTHVVPSLATGSYPRPQSPSATAVTRSPRSYGGGVIRPAPGESSTVPLSLKDMMNSRDKDLREADKNMEKHKVLRDSAIREIERLEAEGKWKPT